MCGHCGSFWGGGGGGVMGWVIRDLRMIWWGRGFGPPRISDPRTAYHTLPNDHKEHSPPYCHFT